MGISEEEILKYEESLENYTNFSPESIETTKGNKTEDKFEELKQKLLANKAGADLTLCIFIAALKSFRANSCLRPFPPQFLRNGEKDFEHLRNVCDIIPPIQEIVNLRSIFSSELLSFLNWLYITKEYPVLKQCLLRDVPLTITNSSFIPQYTFEVCYPTTVDQVFNNRKQNRDTFYAYHGSAIYNFYSILKVGLQQHFSVGKEVLFGNGVYLSSEIAVSTQYAPFAETWSKSALGFKHSIVAVCEVINDVEKVKCKDDSNKQRAINTNGYGEIPPKYFVVTDSDMLRVKYLLVYSYKKKPTVRSFLAKNFCYIVLVLYVLMLVVIGIFKSHTWTKVLRWLTK